MGTGINDQRRGNDGKPLRTGYACIPDLDTIIQIVIEQDRKVLSDNDERYV